ncbi:MAG: hypothetical protein U1F58_16345 [Burkholderiales bacterium]
MREFVARRWATVSALACAVAAFTGCGSDAVTGSPDLPAAFGALKDGHGCPDLAGLYAWPPSEGKAFGYRADGQPEPGYRGGFLGLPVRDDAEVWIAEMPEGAGRLSLHSRLARASPAGGSASEWTTKEPAISCGRGWARLHRDVVASANPNGDIRTEAKITVLADGALAVGQMSTVPQAPYALAIGGFEFFGVARPDRTFWSWAKLARIGDTGEETMPVAVRPAEPAPR